MKVWLIGDRGPEHNNVVSVCKTEEIALREFQKHRKKLLEEAKDRLERLKEEDSSTKMYKRIIRDLSESDPEEIDNYPFRTPYIQEREVIEEER